MNLAFPIGAALLFGVILLTIGPAVSLVAMVAFIVVVLVVARPERGLRMFVLVAPFVPFSTVNLGVRMTISEAMLALTWVGVAWHALAGNIVWPKGAPERRMRWLILWSVVSLFAGLGVAAEGNSLVNWVRWLLNVSPLFLVPLLVHDARERDRLLTWLMVGYLLLLVLSIGVFLMYRDARAMMPILAKLQYAHPEAPEEIFSSDYTRMASPWVHPNATGGALLLATPLALFYGIGHSGWRRMLGVVVALLASAGIVFSGSRGALLALGLLLAWMAFRRVPYTGRLLALGAVLAAALITFYPPALERLASLFSSGDVSTGVRFDEYQHFPEAMARYPFGVGFKVDPPVPGSGLLGISNLWLNLIYKFGVPGLLIYVGIVVAWWKTVGGFGSMRTVTARNAAWFGSVGSVLGALMTSLTDHYFSLTQVLIALFWFVMAISLQEARAAAVNPHSSSGDTGSARSIS